MNIKKRAVGLAVCCVLARGVCAAAETVWFGGTQRALPLSLAAPKEDGLRSLWAFTDEGHQVWDFNLGTDASIWERTSDTLYQSMGVRFGIASRFQFDSGSFDLWAADFRGGGVYGFRVDRTACEASIYHESSHLGDEIIERGDRARIDSNVNGVRLTVSQNLDPHVRVYCGMAGQYWTTPEALETVGFHAGAEATALPPFERGYVAVDAESWEWRNWDPDVTAQIGFFLGPKGRGKALESSRCYMELHAGRVMLGQYYNETETYFGFGLGTSW